MGDIYGSDRSLLDLATALAKRGHEVVVSCPYRGALWAKLGEMSLNRVFLPTSPLVLGWFLLPRSILRLPFQIRNLVRYLQFLRAARFDIIHCNTTHVMEPAIAGKILGVPVVMHCRSILKDNPYIHWIPRRYIPLLINWLSEKVICVSKAVERSLLESGCLPEKLVVVYNGFGLARVIGSFPAFMPDRSEAARGNAIIGCVAQMIPRKRHSILLKAFSILASSVPGARLVIVGGGKPSYVRKLKRMACRLGIGAATQFVGKVRDVGLYYLEFSLFALPSVKEPFAGVYLEAGLFGIPAIGTTSGGAAEVIEDGVTGLIVPPDNPAQLAQAMLKILEDADMAKEMGRRAKQRVSEIFTAQRMVEAIESVYHEVLDCK
jgi:glycosyltransferase involved in cell wall biosynthesis